ncbi:hypothetical protein BDV26DRAFT_250733 [Aspergillus bertholletiae]|uniref:Uncharacterized protein n=1 Tax=Aspergillus bertholletiae TaxID=1226010 RepID=A0A5N7BPJ2_9EURO|nr:hypothetical protein BDV26DRAFT_250733 [Aspergillus bertholletiae]
MKYSMLAVAALVAPALGNPVSYWRQFLRRPFYPEDAGTVIVSNYAPFHIEVDEEPQGHQYSVHPGQRVSIPGAPVADVKLNEQVEVSYVSGDEGTFNYVINPIGSDFSACVNVSPKGCGSLNWCPGEPPTHPVTCPAGTELPITLYTPNSMRATHEFFL